MRKLSLLIGNSSNVKSVRLHHGSFFSSSTPVASHADVLRLRASAWEATTPVMSHLWRQAYNSTLTWLTYANYMNIFSPPWDYAILIVNSVIYVCAYVTIRNAFCFKWFSKKNKPFFEIDLTFFFLFVELYLILEIVHGISHYSATMNKQQYFLRDRVACFDHMLTELAWNRVILVSIQFSHCSKIIHLYSSGLPPTNWHFLTV